MLPVGEFFPHVERSHLGDRTELRTFGQLAGSSGILAGAQSLALIIISPLIGYLVDKLGSYHAASIAIGLWAIPGGIIWIAMRPAVRYLPPARIHAPSRSIIS